jgi:hypothetical protein
MAAYRMSSLTPPDGRSTAAQPLSKDESPVKSPDKSPDRPHTASGTRTRTFKSMFRDASDMFERMTEQDFIKWQKYRGVSMNSTNQLL